MNIITYKEFEKQVFDWFSAKHQIDSKYTFSIRQNAIKGAELDYFIGTENSNYFGTTFWTIPVSYPGSSSDFIDLHFSFTKNGKLFYFFEVAQTRNPHDSQNKAALELAKMLKLKLKEEFSTYEESDSVKKTEWCKVGGQKDEYDDMTSLFVDLDKDLLRFITVVDDSILKIKLDYPLFTAHRITEAEFGTFFEKMKKRFAKYSTLPAVMPHNTDGENNIQEQENEADKNSSPLNQILYGPPGTGKTFSTITEALKIINPLFKSADRKILKAEFDRLMKEGQIVFTTFHQSMSYEDFIEGIKPQQPEANDAFIRYLVEPGIFKQICLNAQTPDINDFERSYAQLIEELNSLPDGEYLRLLTPSNKEFYITSNSRNNINLHTGVDKRKSGAITKSGLLKELNGEPYYKWWNGYFEGVMNYLKSQHNFIHENIQNDPKPYVLIIDEINRGNVSQIFGELITLIEDDKRLGMPESLEITLPYSKEKFGVPPNLYIIGTMNTADRSVEALDAALRRRFSFVEMAPKPERLGSIVGVDLKELLTVINKRIEKLLDKDHQIGHSYFMSVKRLEDLRRAFENKILPLLQEYFFGDYSKIGLVLGDDFVEAEKKSVGDFFATFEGDKGSEYEDRITYKIKNISNLTAADFVKVYSPKTKSEA